MSIGSQQQATLRFREPSNKQLRQYFSSNWLPGMIAGTIIIIFGILLIIVGVLMIYFGTTATGVIIIVAGVIMIYIGWTVFRHSSDMRISDEEYDEWLEQQVRRMEDNAFIKLRINRNALVDPVLTIHSFVLPGSSLAKNYAEETVLMKKGKDGHWRFSFNVYTFLFPFAGNIVVYSQSINAIDMSLRRWQHNLCRRHHIITADVSDSNNNVLIGNEWYSCRVQRAYLRTVSQKDDLFLGAYMKAIATSSSSKVRITLRDTDSDQILIDLHNLLLAEPPSYWP